MTNKKTDQIPSDDIDALLKAVSEHFDTEDRSVRERQIRIWRSLKLYWGGFQKIWYSEVAHDWRVWDQSAQASDTDQSAYDKPINIFRAYLESIIAALSVSVPGIKCYPDDAENPNDINTAKAGDKIAILISRHNNVMLLWIHALYVYATEGMVACYTYPHEDEKYGTYEEKEFENVETEAYKCAGCGATLPEDILSNDEFRPKSEYDLPGDSLNRDENGLEDIGEIASDVLCPDCQAVIPPDLMKTPLTVTKLVGVTNKPKTRQCMEVYGGLYVKIPNYSAKQCDIPYLRFSYEAHYSTVIERYASLRDKITPGQSATNSSGQYDSYEALGRLSPQYNGDMPTNSVTVNNYWFRPSAFNVLNDEQVKTLKKKFPDGCKYVKVNEHSADARNEKLDDYWTIASNPLSDYLHYDPIGMLLTSVQDITNDLVSLVIQTIEHGIPQTFADPGVLNFETYRQTETVPGAIYPATPKAGKSVGEGFYEVKTATLSGEILPFGQSIQQMGQMVSGALPSLFGGTNQGGGQTASEYSMSRAQALQRLQTAWKMLTLWWKDIYGKVIPAYIQDVVEDERTVEKDEAGNFINVIIRKAELQGKIGQVELEASEQLPTTWAQKRDIVMQLIQLNNPEILEMLSSPENIGILAQAIGLEDFKVPGEADRIKQYEEIQQLVQSEPIEVPPDPMLVAQFEQNPEAMQDPALAQELAPKPMPSVEIDELLDNHEIESQICRSWLVSDAGRLAKVENPAGYANVLLHMKQHVDVMMRNQMALAAQASSMGPDGQPQGPDNKNSQGPAAGATNGQRPDKPVQKTPINEEKDARRFTNS